MKKIQIKDNIIKNGVLLSSSESDTKFIRYDLDSYAVIASGETEPMYAFESKKISGVLHVLDEPITSVSLVLIHAVDSETEEQAFELRLFLESGQVVICDSYGQTGILNAVDVELSKEDSLALPVCEIWDLPDVDPYRKMMFSKLLLQKLGSVFDHSPPVDVVDRIWADFERLKEPLLFDDVVRVDGEFGAYALTELKCGRIVVMTREETEDGY